MPYVVDFDPVIVSLGPLALRWYSLAYVVGFLAAYGIWLRLGRLSPAWIAPEAWAGTFVVGVVMVVIGGRLGYGLFYAADYYLAHPHKVLFLWEGGMSFHGALLGSGVFAWYVARRCRVPLLWLCDTLAAATPPGLFFGRLANFVNGELWGRPADVPWAMIFPRADFLPRHPSQLYEAALEGVLLFGLLALMSWPPGIRERLGLRFGVFLAGYGLARTMVEFYREPSGMVSCLGFEATTGQALSLPMVVFGLGFVALALWREPTTRLVTTMPRLP